MQTAFARSLPFFFTKQVDVPVDVTSFDHRHQFVASGVYELPLFTGAGGIAERVFGGWRVNPIFTALSGAPFDQAASAGFVTARPARAYTSDCGEAISR